MCVEGLPLSDKAFTLELSRGFLRICSASWSSAGTLTHTHMLTHTHTHTDRQTHTHTRSQNPKHTHTQKYVHGCSNQYLRQTYRHTHTRMLKDCIILRYWQCVCVCVKNCTSNTNCCDISYVKQHAVSISYKWIVRKLLKAICKQKHESKQALIQTPLIIKGLSIKWAPTSVHPSIPPSLPTSLVDPV